MPQKPADAMPSVAAASAGEVVNLPPDLIRHNDVRPWRAIPAGRLEDVAQHLTHGEVPGAQRPAAGERVPHGAITGTSARLC
jgi:hypothetical protein